MFVAFHVPTRDATHIVVLEAFDEYGDPELAEAPGEFSDTPEQMSSTVYLDEAVQEGELLQLLIDGEVVDELTLDAQNIANQEATLNAGADKFINQGDQSLDIVLRTINERGDEAVSDIWTQTFG